MVNLKSVSTADLTAELRRREKAADVLNKQREKLLAELQRVESELGEAGATTSRRRARDPDAPKRPRARNEVSLGDALVQAVEVRAVVTPAEAAQFVQANGYESTSKNFNMMVSNALARDPRFRRIARGQYERIS